MELPRRSAREMAVIEANAVARGATIDGLMEHAGRAVAEEAARRLPQPPARVAVVAGVGNNGGDGTCAAFYLAQWGYAPEVWLVAPPSEVRSAAARRGWERFAAGGPTHVGVPTPAELAGFPWVIDALLGTGQQGELRPPYSEAAEAMRAAGVPILSVDEPTGLGSAHAIRPSITVTFTFAKEGMDPTSSGEIVVRDIGIPPEATFEVGPGEFLLLPPVPRAGRTGRVVVVGGGPYAGAPALAALAALRAGAERATVLCPRAVAEALRANSPDLVVVPIGGERFAPEDGESLLGSLEGTRVAALAVGMGTGRAPGTVAALRTLLAGRGSRTPCVVDADGLEAALGIRSDVPGPPLVITPNAGELVRLGRLAAPPTEAERVRAAERLARTHHVTVLAKGATDVLVEGERTYLNRHHHPAATVAGAGDVLSGVVAALLAQGLEGLAAARLAAYWVGEAGIRLAERNGRGILATDLLEELPAVEVGERQRLRDASQA
jgi:ADP-dependent NAD(P)H-hydrate dehydratase / NAD(P)H-hydrate epimerase